MAYVVERNLVHGTRFMGIYLTDRHKRSAGHLFPSCRRLSARPTARNSRRCWPAPGTTPNSARSRSATTSRPSGSHTSISRPPRWRPNSPRPASDTWSSPTPRTTNPAPSASDKTWLQAYRRYHTETNILGRDQLLFPTRAGTPISRNTFRTRIWQPAVKAAGIAFAVRVHDLRHAHASWLLAGGADLKSVMERMGHAQIQTTQKYLHTLPTPTNATSTPSPASKTGPSERPPS